jgi:hypothetical protein
MCGCGRLEEEEDAAGAAIVRREAARGRARGGGDRKEEEAKGATARDSSDDERRTVAARTKDSAEDIDCRGGFAEVQAWLLARLLSCSQLRLRQICARLLPRNLPAPLRPHLRRRALDPPLSSLTSRAWAFLRSLSCERGNLSELLLRSAPLCLLLLSLT